MFSQAIHPVLGATMPVSLLRPLLRGVGTVHFGESLLETMNHAVVFDHCTLWEFHANQAPVVVGLGTYGSQARVTRAMNAYINDFHYSEPVRARVSELGEELFIRYHSSDELPDCAWRHTCYESAKIMDRLSIVTRLNDRSWFMANFFRDRGRAPLDRGDIAAACGIALPIALAGRQNALLRGTDKGADFTICCSSNGGVVDRLSKREKEVCTRIASGHQVREIALDMHICESTVVTYRRRAYEKLGVGSSEELSRLLRSERFLTSETAPSLYRSGIPSLRR